jgi:hypothetical protein
MVTNMEAALAVEARIQKFLEEFIVPFRREGQYPNHALDKLLAAIGGWSCAGTRLRWPYQWIEESEAQRLRPIARHRLPELFSLGTSLQAILV